MKQTAIEWLVEQIKKDPNLRLRGFDIDGIAEQAKAMEKEQIVNAINDAQNPLIIHPICFNRIGKTDLTLGDCYYNEIYTNE
jgi:hypothetical protein